MNELHGKYAARCREYLEYVDAHNDWVSPEVIAARGRFQQFFELYDFNPKVADSIISLIERGFVHSKGQSVDAEPMTGKPFILQPWMVFCVYAIFGWYYRGTPRRVVTTAYLYMCRKSSKTTFAAMLLFAAMLVEPGPGFAVANVAKHIKEFYELIQYQITHKLFTTRLKAEQAGWHFLNSTGDRRIDHADIVPGGFHLMALPANEHSLESHNGKFVYVDEMHSVSDEVFTRIVGATMAYTNKLVLITTSGGTDINSYGYDKLQEFRECVLHPARPATETLEDSKSLRDSDRVFAFICKADDDGDLLDERQWRKANPSYGVTINYDNFYTLAANAVRSARARGDFETRYLGRYSSLSLTWFDPVQFQNSDAYVMKQLGLDPRMSQDVMFRKLAEMPIFWFGGADLSKLHDLTAAALFGRHTDLGVEIIVSHAWFPGLEQERKAREDKIPVFQWLEAGVLDIVPGAVNSPAVVAQWFASMRAAGFNIRNILFDTKYSPEFVAECRLLGLPVEPQAQYAFVKSLGFRQIERGAKTRMLSYLNNPAFLYSVANVAAQEKQDDIVYFHKVAAKARIDLFDAAVMAALGSTRFEADRRVNDTNLLFAIGG